MSSYTEFKVFMWTSLVVEMKTFGKHTNNMRQYYRVKGEDVSLLR